MTSSKQLTIRGVPSEVAKRLKDMSLARGESVNTTVLHLLKSATGVDERRERLLRYATWTAEDLREFEASQKLQRTIDTELWR